MGTLTPLARLRQRIAQLIARQSVSDDANGTLVDQDQTTSKAFREATSIHEALREHADEIEYRLKQIKIVRSRDGDT